MLFLLIIIKNYYRLMVIVSKNQYITNKIGITKPDFTMRVRHRQLSQILRPLKPYFIIFLIKYN